MPEIWRIVSSFLEGEKHPMLSTIPESRPLLMASLYIPSITD
jgi:hypothetical protein